jgi:CRISPR/Cas system-associated protein endoribonuclease Cas2
MGKAKQGKDIKTYELTEKEFNYIKILNLALQFNELKNKIFSGFLYYVCNSRLGYNETQNLLFEVDLEDEKRQLKVQIIPTEAIEQELQKG